ncbi:hypothetical protein [Streptomyces sp. NPDC047042]
MPARTPSTVHTAADALSRLTDGLRENPDHPLNAGTPLYARRCGRCR